MNFSFLSIAEEDERAKQLKSLKEEQQEVLQEYDEKKKDLEVNLRKEIQALEESKAEKRQRINLMKEFNQKQAQLTKDFKAKLKEIQDKERALRGPTKKEEAIDDRQHSHRDYYETIQERQERQDLLERARKQDLLYFQDNQGTQKKKPTQPPIPAPTQGSPASDTQGTTQRPLLKGSGY